MAGRSLLAVSALFTSLAGCAPTPPAPAPAPMTNTVTSPAAPAEAGGMLVATGSGGQCSAAPAQGAMGQLATQALLEAARVQAGAQTARVLRPGQMITKEFNFQRLNLDVDAAGRVTKVYCG